MKYNAPFGNSDEDAIYINGNPETGTMGSIPPAASIEYPQREIVNLINVTGLTPTNSDLLQLAKAVQSGQINYGVDVGAPNQVAVAPVVPVTAYRAGLRMVIKLASGNTSQVTVNVSGLGAVPLIHSDLSAMLAYELTAGQLIDVIYDGAYFQLVGGGNPSASVIMVATSHLYVNGVTGDDSLYDGTSSTITGPHGGPFRTIQKALSTMVKYNLGGWDFYIHVADSVYSNSSPVLFPMPNGSGNVHLVGNVSNPAAVSIFNVGTGSAWHMRNGGSYIVDGFSFRTTAQAPGDQGHGIWSSGATTLHIVVAYWNAVVGSHIVTGPGGFTLVQGTQTSNGGASLFHQHAYTNGQLLSGVGLPSDPDMIISGAASFGSAFVGATEGGQARPIWKSYTGFSNATGPKYSANTNGVIQTIGRGVSYLPGTVAGSTSSGGQYA